MTRVPARPNNSCGLNRTLHFRFAKLLRVKRAIVLLCICALLQYAAACLTWACLAGRQMPIAVVSHVPPEGASELIVAHGDVASRYRLVLDSVDLNMTDFNTAYAAAPHRALLALRTAASTAQASQADAVHVVDVLDIGWPLHWVSGSWFLTDREMRGTVFTAPRLQPTSKLTLVRMSVPVRMNMQYLSYNTVLCAAIARVLAVAYCGGRRALRRRAGRCVQCGYPRGAFVCCSECGRYFGSEPDAR